VGRLLGLRMRELYGSFFSALQGLMIYFVEIFCANVNRSSPLCVNWRGGKKLFEGHA
jgi:hypothetical protein